MSAEQPPLKIASLAWGVKESFRRYVEAAGTIEVSGAAARDADGGFVFAATDDSDLRVGADGAVRGRAAFSGTVHFKAHGGMLNVRLIDPVVEIGEKALLFVNAESGGRTLRAEFAQLAAATAGAREIFLPAKLAFDGSDVLEHYPAMTPIDPVRLMLGAPTTK